MDFEAQLVDSSRFIAELVAANVGNNPGHFKKLMELLYKISEIEPGLKIELMSAIEEQIPKGSSGIKVIGRRLLKKLHRETEREGLRSR